MKHYFRSLISALLVAVTLILTVPFTDASDTYTAVRIDGREKLTSGRYVIVCSENGHAMASLSSAPYWINTVSVIDYNGTLKVFSDLIWTVTVNGDSATLTDPSGNAVSPTGGNKNGIKAGEYSWQIVCVDGVFKLCGTGDDTVRLACNTVKGEKGGNNRFRAYKSTTAGKANYPDTFIFYKVSGLPPSQTQAPTTAIPAVTEPPVTEPETQAPIPDEPIGNKAAVKITDKNGLVSGNYIVASANGYAMTIYDNGWILSSPIDSNVSVIDTVYPITVWTLTVKDGYVTLTDPNDVSAAPKGGETNGIKSDQYEWILSFENGAFKFGGKNEDTVRLATNNTYDFKLRAYKISTLEGKFKNSYCDVFTCSRL